ncbi:unnamed protein product, partial [Musa acuminata subsp. burmannicoides]
MNAHATLTGTRGNPGYADPELWMPLPMTQNCYVYSFGVVLGKKLDARRSMNSVVRKLAEEEEISMSSDSFQYLPSHLSSPAPWVIGILESS